MSAQPAALLVEDDAAIRDALQELLESTGYRVTAVATAEQGLAALRRERVTLLVTDLALPRESGAWLVTTGRAEGLLTRTKVVVVSAVLMLPRLEDAHIFRKPLEIDAFLEAVAVRAFPAGEGGSAGGLAAAREAPNK